MSHPSAVLGLNGPKVLLVMKRPQVCLVQEAASTSSDHSTGQSRMVLPPLSRVCDARDRNALTELRRRFPTFSSSNGAVARSGSVRRHGNVGRLSRGSEIKDITIVGAQVEKMPLGWRDKLLYWREKIM